MEESVELEPDAWLASVWVGSRAPAERFLQNDLLRTACSIKYFNQAAGRRTVNSSLSDDILLPRPNFQQQFALGAFYYIKSIYTSVPKLHS